MTQIITPQFNSWHCEQAYAMEEEHRRTLDRIIDENKDMTSYFILVYAYADPFIEGVIRTKFLHGIPPEALKASVVKNGILGTILYWRNNEKMQGNELVRVWVLPIDRPYKEEFLSDTVDNAQGKLSVWNCSDDAERMGIPILLN